MFIQIGIIAYKDKQTCKYTNLKSLHIPNTKAIAKAKNDFYKNACDMFVFDLLEYAKKS